MDRVEQTVLDDSEEMGMKWQSIVVDPRDRGTE